MCCFWDLRRIYCIVFPNLLHLFLFLESKRYMINENWQQKILWYIVDDQLISLTSFLTKYVPFWLNVNSFHSVPLSHKSCFLCLFSLLFCHGPLLFGLNMDLLANGLLLLGITWLFQQWQICWWICLVCGSLEATHALILVSLWWPINEISL